eukprot:TRINITY_DN2918_c0_g3_i2.p1 TRINITY_DN2918_c0_g3~~TRINITY_DN2918_c0_g3_i2.p1  ORF type:complete len:422 (-),score=127.74 TRINITY_DN2918_c0_g3_i2:224-1489(-)
MCIRDRVSTQSTWGKRKKKQLKRQIKSISETTISSQTLVIQQMADIQKPVEEAKEGEKFLSSTLKEYKPNDQHNPPNLDCRFYENIYPQKDDLVVVQVKDIVENGAYVDLVEYNNIQGMITHNEMSKQVNIKSVHKAMKVGKTEVAIVLRVDSEKGYIDLSKKRVPADGIKECEERVARGKKVHSILRAVAEKLRIDVERLYEGVAWPLAKKLGSSFEAFRHALIDPDKIFGLVEIAAEIKDKLYKEIQRRLTPQPVTVRSDFELSCYTYEGIEAIKEALRAGEKKGTEQAKLKCQIIAAPNYTVTTETHDKNHGIQVVKDALNEIEAVIKSKNGKFERKHETPIVVGEKGEKNAVEGIDEHLEENGEDSENSEDNDEGMGDADIGVDTEELDRQAAAKTKDEDDDQCLILCVIFFLNLAG